MFRQVNPFALEREVNATHGSHNKTSSTAGHKWLAPVEKNMSPGEIQCK